MNVSSSTKPEAIDEHVQQELVEVEAGGQHVQPKVIVDSLGVCEASCGNTLEYWPWAASFP